MLINQVIQRIGNKNTIGTIITTIQVFGFRAHLEVDSQILLGVSPRIAVLTALNKQAFWPHDSHPRLESGSSHIQQNDNRQASKRRQNPTRRGKITSQEMTKSDSSSLEAPKSRLRSQSRYFFCGGGALWGETQSKPWPIPSS